MKRFGKLGSSRKIPIILPLWKKSTIYNYLFIETTLNQMIKVKQNWKNFSHGSLEILILLSYLVIRNRNRNCWQQVLNDHRDGRVD